MKTIINTIFSAAIILSISSCAVKMASLDQLNNKQWILSNIEGEPLEKLSKPVSLNFKTNAVEGFLGCNNYTAKMDLKKEEVKFSEITGTMKSCVVGSATENKMTNVLRKANKIEVKNGKLILKEGKTKLAEFVDARSIQ